MHRRTTRLSSRPTGSLGPLMLVLTLQASWTGARMKNPSTTRIPCLMQLRMRFQTRCMVSPDTIQACGWSRSSDARMKNPFTTRTPCLMQNFASHLQVRRAVFLPLHASWDGARMKNPFTTRTPCLMQKFASLLQVLRAISLREAQLRSSLFKRLSLSKSSWMTCMRCLLTRQLRHSN